MGAVKPIGNGSHAVQTADAISTPPEFGRDTRHCHFTASTPPDYGLDSIQTASFMNDRA